jgi:hypothetical protein
MVMQIDLRQIGMPVEQIAEAPATADITPAVDDARTANGSSYSCACHVESLRLLFLCD